ncbi:DotG/IcmE/VirB10 family protein [Tabrizicola sp.]|uniref:DotG/IcmE/VirB10 family protein n=1 Tax=Tabrizicola sp. TaxID=2005166 RepID=UPI0027366F24|nr:DotG/IcmE/VirB10 family protein [Tabrizicola sp.]MDP3194407.1 DotG/IcmE/VirB10 family protein [Tabrizicola sp.]
MSDANNNGTGANPDAVAEDQGFSPEPAVNPQANGAARKADADVRRRNLRATFGSGPGKLALIAAAVVVVVFGVLAATNMRDAPVVGSKAQVDAPTSPQNRVSTNAVTPEEATRRAEQSRREAEEAQNKGGSYQPGFDYNIGASSKQESPGAPAKFAGFATPEEEAARAQANGSARSMQAQPMPSGAAPQQQTPQQQAEQQRRDQELQRAAAKLETDQKQAEGDRDKYVESVSQEIVKQIGGMFASQGSDSLNNLGAYTQSTYYVAPARGASSGAAASAMRAASRKPTIKAGNTMFATLDSEANTDDGRTVLATVRSGPWKGAKLIGMIEQSYNNISLTFMTLAPQDERSTMRIRAVALREQDAKMGMAEKIDHHTLSRYSSLAAAALLQGAGRVYQQPVGTTVSTPGGIITTNEMPRDRQVIGSAVGEMGSAIGAEIRRRGFNQPSTYSTPAETGFVLYFLEDVLPANSDEQQQQQQQQQQPQQLTAQQLAQQLAQQQALQQSGGQGNAVNAPTPVGFPQAGQGTFNPGYGTTPYGYAPGGTGAAPSQYQGTGYDNRYRGPLNSNY